MRPPQEAWLTNASLRRVLRRSRRPLMPRCAQETADRVFASVVPSECLANGRAPAAVVLWPIAPTAHKPHPQPQ